MRKLFTLFAIVSFCTFGIQSLFAGGGPTVMLTDTVRGCPGDTLALDAMIAGGLAPYTVVWTPATNIVDPNAASTGAIVTSANFNYTINVTDANGDTVSADVLLIHDGFVFTAGTDITLDCGKNTGAVFITPISGNLNNVTYAWSDGGSGFFRSNLPPTNYTIVGTNSEGCEYIDDLLVSWTPTGQHLSFGFPSLACFDSVITFHNRSKFIDAIGVDPITWTWDFGDGTMMVNNDTFVTHTYATTGAYTVNLNMTFGSNGCSMNLSQILNVADCSFTGPCEIDSSLTEPGLSPDQQDLACIIRGQHFEDTIQFVNFDSAELAPGSFALVNWIIIKSVNNLPCGISWQADRPNRYYENSERGCIRLYGTSVDSVGQYPLDIRVSAEIKIGGLTITLLDASASDLGLAFAVRVSEQGLICPAVDTLPPVDTSWACNSGTGDLIVITDGLVKVCPGQSAQLNVTTLLGEPPYSYVWTPTTGLSCANCPDPVATVNTATVYTVEVIDAFNTRTSNFVTVDVSQISVDAGANQSLSCGQFTTNVTATPSGDLEPPLSYVWSTGDSTQTATGVGSGTHTVTVTNGFGCTASDDVTINVAAAITVDIGNDTAFCDLGTRVILLDPVVLTQGTGIYEYAWSPASGLDDSTVFTPTATLNATTTYVLTINDLGNGCEFKDTITFTFIDFTVDAGEDSLICNDSSITLNPTFIVPGSGNYSYSWSPATGLDDPALANPTASPDSTTTYTAVVTDLDYGCISSDSVTVMIEICVGIQEPSLSDLIRIHPNPNTGQFTISMDRVSANQMEIEIITLEGKTIFAADWDRNGASQKIIDLGDIPSGLYFVKMRSGGMEGMQKIMIQ